MKGVFNYLLEWRGVIEMRESDNFRFINPRMVLICSFRYALGRRTYVPSMIVEELILNWAYLTEFDKNQIQNDIRHTIHHDMAGDQCDIDEWNKILGLKVE